MTDPADRELLYQVAVAPAMLVGLSLEELERRADDYLPGPVYELVRGTAAVTVTVEQESDDAPALVRWWKPRA